MDGAVGAGTLDPVPPAHTPPLPAGPSAAAAIYAASVGLPGLVFSLCRKPRSGKGVGRPAAGLGGVLAPLSQ